MSTENKPAGFNFSFSADVWLDLEQIWPDGDAPENPTAEDVAKVVEEAGGVHGVLRDWSLDDHLDLMIDGNGTVAHVRGGW